MDIFTAEDFQQELEMRRALQSHNDERRKMNAIKSNVLEFLESRMYANHIEARFDNDWLYSEVKPPGLNIDPRDWPVARKMMKLMKNKDSSEFWAGEDFDPTKKPESLTVQRKIKLNERGGHEDRFSLTSLKIEMDEIDDLDLFAARRLKYKRRELIVQEHDEIEMPCLTPEPTVPKEITKASHISPKQPDHGQSNGITDDLDLLVSRTLNYKRREATDREDDQVRWSDTAVTDFVPKIPSEDFIFPSKEHDKGHTRITPLLDQKAEYQFPLRNIFPEPVENDDENDDYDIDAILKEITLDEPEEERQPCKGHMSITVEDLSSTTRTQLSGQFRSSVPFSERKLKKSSGLVQITHYNSSNSVPLSKADFDDSLKEKETVKSHYDLVPKRFLKGHMKGLPIDGSIPIDSLQTAPLDVGTTCSSDNIVQDKVFCEKRRISVYKLDQSLSQKYKARLMRKAAKKLDKIGDKSRLAIADQLEGTNEADSKTAKAEISRDSQRHERLSPRNVSSTSTDGSLTESEIEAYADGMTSPVEHRGNKGNLKPGRDPQKDGGSDVDIVGSPPTRQNELIGRQLPKRLFNSINTGFRKLSEKILSRVEFL